MLTTKITNIADSIRDKTGTTKPMTLDEMPSKIEGIRTEPRLQGKEVIPTKEIQSVRADEGFDALSEVNVKAIPDEYIIPDGTLNVASNGDIDVTTFKTARVGVYTPPNLQDKAVEITENGITTITADNGYDGLNNVEVTTNVTGSGGMYAPRKISFSAYMGTELEAETSNLDTSNLTSMASMFAQCYNLTSVNTSHFITNKVTNMYRVFYDCGNLTTPNLTSFDTSNVTVMHEMFYNCTKMKNTLDLSSFNTSKVTNMNNMFYNAGIETIIFGENFNTNNVTSMTGMFSGTRSLNTLVIKSPNFILKSSDVFGTTGLSTLSGSIYVPDAYVNTYKTRSYWSTYANVIKPLSEWQG